MAEQVEPQQPQRPSFGTSWKGYDRAEVDAFLDSVAKEIEALRIEYRSVAAERDQLAAQQDQVQDVLMAAQRAADELKVAARREGDEIIREAEKRALKMDQELRDRMQKLQMQFESARKDFDEFLSSARNLAHGFIRKIDETRGFG
jgi:cell division initiation protein